MKESVVEPTPTSECSPVKVLFLKTIELELLIFSVSLIIYFLTAVFPSFCVGVKL